MIISKVMGGLGNQLYIYSASYALAKSNDTDLILDKLIYQTDTWRKFQLDLFNTEYNKSLTPFKKIKIKYTKPLFRLRHNLELKKYKATEIKEIKNYHYQVIKIDKNSNYYLNGYWQDYKYFDIYRDDLIRQFTLKNISEQAKALADKARKETPIALHIRRTDYASYKGGMLLGLSYYKEALGIMKEKFGNNAPIWIFTDDIDFCKDAFSFIPDIFFPGENANISDTEEFFVMTCCHDFIIANSSFSWWAAYLSNSENKKVIAPIVSQWVKGIYPPDWNAIEAKLQQDE